VHDPRPENGSAHPAGGVLAAPRPSPEARNAATRSGCRPSRSSHTRRRTAPHPARSKNPPRKGETRPIAADRTQSSALPAAAWPAHTAGSCARRPGPRRSHSPPSPPACRLAKRCSALPSLMLPARTLPADGENRQWRKGTLVRRGSRGEVFQVRRRDGRLACRRLVEPSIPHPSLQSTRRLEEIGPIVPQRTAAGRQSWIQRSADHPIQATERPCSNPPPARRPPLVTSTTLSAAHLYHHNAVVSMLIGSDRAAGRPFKSSKSSRRLREYDRQHSQSVAKPTRSAAV